MMDYVEEFTRVLIARNFGSLTSASRERLPTAAAAAS